MSYLSQAMLQVDGDFTFRVTAALTEQGAVFVNDARADIKALAEDWLAPKLGSPNQLTTWMQLMASQPGFAAEVDNDDGTIDSSRVSDPEILSSVQALYPEVAGLLYDSTGTPKGTS